MNSKKSSMSKYVVSKTLHRTLFNAVFRSNMFYMRFIWNVLEGKNNQAKSKRSNILLDFLHFFYYIQTVKSFNVLRVNSQRFQSYSLSTKIFQSQTLKLLNKNTWIFNKVYWKFRKSIDIKYNVVVYGLLRVSSN